MPKNFSVTAHQFSALSIAANRFLTRLYGYFCGLVNNFSMDIYYA